MDSIEKKITKLKSQKHQLQQQVKYQTQSTYRKERARRLIETGALAEKYFNLDNLTIADREELFKMFSPFVTANKPKKFKDKQKNDAD
ncbi:hypothetical protein [Bacillus sp. 1P06AnD]|uniref:hypothetical protein n=1 Tax=Bacillus sp. 1P06AnD TaxID=3132208 RepID=UPI00399FB1EF